MFKTLLATIALLTALGIHADSEPKTCHHRTFDAALWTQSSVEWRAHCHQTYNLAQAALKKRLRDHQWTAATEQYADQERGEKAPAIIVDIDETVLDNSPYQARLVLDNDHYKDETWDLWVHQEAAYPVPGSLAFLSKAAQMGIEIFYVTNRKAHLEESTRNNLAKYGYPLSKSIDTVLMKNEKKDWLSDKGSRRALIAKTHRILMLIGDDYGDFSSAAKTDKKTREESSRSNQQNWGQGWFILPNPTYGSWKDAIVNFDRSLSAKLKAIMEREAFDPRLP